MFKRIEQWLRRTITEEVAKIAGDLAKERREITAAFAEQQTAVMQSTKSLAQQKDDFEEFAKNQKTDYERYIAFVFERELSTHVARLKNKLSHWKADDETLAADRILRRAK